jgi:hypothetical protein
MRPGSTDAARIEPRDRFPPRLWDAGFGVWYFRGFVISDPPAAENTKARNFENPKILRKAARDSGGHATRKNLAAALRIFARGLV